MRGYSSPGALAILTAGIQTAVDRVFDDMVTERRRLDAAVDSAAELERLKTGCEGPASQWAPALRERPSPASVAPIRGGHSRIRDGDRVQWQLGGVSRTRF